MTYLLALFALLLAAAFASSTLKVRFEMAMPIALMAIGLVLYFFYIAGFLHLGFAIVVVAIVLGAAWLLMRLMLAGNLGSLPRLAFTPQVTTFLVVYLICFIATRGATVGMWDELRLWGAYPKLLHELGILQLGPQAELFESMQPYTPGMPLLAYFFGAFAPAFDESAIFFTYSVVATTFLLPVAKRVKWRRFYLIPVVSAVMVAVPLYFWNSSNDAGNMFGSLFIDTFLGLLGGFGCYLIATGAAHRRGGLVAIALTATTLFLFKETGLTFAIILIAIATFQIVLARRAATGPRGLFWLRLLVRLAILLLPLASVAISWKIVLATHGVGAALGYDYLGSQYPSGSVNSFIYALLTHPIMYSSLTLGSIRGLASVALVFFALGGLAWAWLSGGFDSRGSFREALSQHRVLLLVVSGFLFILGFIAIFAFAGQYSGNISFGVVCVAFFVLALSIFVRLARDGHSARRLHDYAFGCLAVVAINSAFAIGLYFLTTVAFQGELSSFSRYISTPAVVSLTFVVLYLATRRWSLPSGKFSAIATLVLAFTLAFLAVAFPLRLPTKYEGGWDVAARSHSNAILNGISEEEPDLESESRIGVFLVFAGDPFEDAGLHHRTYFDLLGSGVVVRNFFTETEIATRALPSSATYESDVAAARELFNAQLADGRVDYVYIAEADVGLKDQFRDVFGGDMSAGFLYKIDRSHANPGLVRVE